MKKDISMKQQFGFLMMVLLISSQLHAKTTQSPLAKPTKSLISSNANREKNESEKPIEIDFTQAPFFAMSFYELSGLSEEQKTAYFEAMTKNMVELHTGKNFSANIKLTRADFESLTQDQDGWKELRKKVYMACLEPSLQSLNSKACKGLEKGREDALESERAAPLDENKPADTPAAAGAGAVGSGRP